MAKILNTRFLPALAVCLLASTALNGSAQAGWFDFGSGKTDISDSSKSNGPRVVDRTGDKPAPAADLESSIRQAQMLRVAGDYDGAIKHLSQLMLVAADDGRVVSEYGKTLAAQGRAREAVDFLSRAQQLQGNDWTVYNALGVAYDELDKQDQARAAYDHALALKPDEAAVLNNYALSRMLAKDPDGAKALMARAQGAGGASDPKIARNIALVDKLATADAAPQAVAAAQPHNAAAQSGPAPSAAPRIPVAAQPMPRVAQSQPVPNMPAPAGAPRALQPASSGVIDVQPQMTAQAQARGVVMQRVPEDPQAGPVHAASHAPRTLTLAPKAVAKAESPKPANAAEDLQAKADAIARTLNGKPAAIAQAKAEAEKPAAPAPKTPAPKAVAKAETPKADLPKAVARVEMSKPTEAKAVPVKAVAKKDAIPALRLSANAY